jgi:hypothetical protein
LASDSSRGLGRTGRDRPELSTTAAPETPSPPGWLVLKLVIADTEPLSGSVSRPGCPSQTVFHGWIDLISAINSLRAASPERDENP